ncbi:capsular polysaccharide transport system permease protein [Sphingomonas vulcanisoli]|uniref:Capsular polysaccharide transport system permease protein n=1 Tax=Sphingomonas vulcanisoli TaxID=1658060 RepID=A0ABX0TYE7_9SPHN|nr:lipopolysaccharide biosynthesis protein [Sphingomonas vulcanisoli]NIJ09440.1 capsular polysaccharide transport system permease protein [Sphingomonas vulcanisoli]
MNMHGAFTTIGDSTKPDESRWAKIKDRLVRYRLFLIVVVAPLLVAAFYLYAIASDQYESEAHFLVRTVETKSAPASGGLGQILSMATGSSSAQSETMSVADFLTSHDVVKTLRSEDQLVERFRRSDIDLFDRLSSDNPTPEKLLSFYRKYVSVQFDTDTGITELKVRSFSPQDSYELIQKLLTLGEQHVNMLNQRSYNDSVLTAQRQLAEAEVALAVSQERISNFRAAKADIDPTASGQAQITMVASLSQQLAAARAQLTAMGGLINPASPQYRATAAHVAALSTQVALQNNKLAGSGQTIASDVSGYEDLKLRQQFAAKRYESAAASLQDAREQARRQQLYLVRVVAANEPVKSTYPKRLRWLGTALVALLLLYAIIWLLIAGVREHAA